MTADQNKTTPQFIDEDAVLTPPQAERYLKQVNNELARAQISLQRTRFYELKMKRAYIEAKTKLLFSVWMSALTVRSVSSS